MPVDSRLTVGLGNPGPEYADTRHNVGRMVIARLADQLGAGFSRHRRAHAEVATGRIGPTRVTLMNSRGYMNESGGPVSAVLAYEKLPVDQLVVVHDDLDLEFGRIRVKLGGGDGGHNGLKSIRKSLGSGDFLRVRVGIGRPPGRQDPADYVLRPFGAEQRRELPTILAEGVEAIEVLLLEGLEVAQNRFHAR